MKQNDECIGVSFVSREMSSPALDCFHFVSRETLHRKRLRLGGVSRETGAMPQKIFKNFKITIAKFQKVLYNKFTDDNLEVKYIWER